MAIKIQLPDDAPFTPAQRAWLDDFLGKALAEASAPKQTGLSVPVTVLYGTQTGNAEGLAKKLLKTLKKRHYDATIADMANWPWLAPFVFGKIYNEAKTFLSIHEYENVARWAKQIAARPAVKRGRIVNKTNGPLEDQLHERHDAGDFATKTQDKLEGVA